MNSLLPKRFGRTHACSLAKGSDSCLPKLPPQSGKFKKWLRYFRKSLMVSPKNTKSKMFFRSRAAITLEKKRHLRTSRAYIIHPFSQIRIKHEIIMCLSWLISFIHDPLTVAFHNYQSEHVLWIILDISITSILTFNIFINFFTGIVNVKTKEVILDFKAIAYNYITTYFVFDFLGTLPVELFAVLISQWSNDTAVYLKLSGFLNFLLFVRMKTTLDYFRRITDLVKLEESNHKIICLVLLSFYILHWWTCLVYIFPMMKYYATGELEEDSWLSLAKIHPKNDIAYGKRYVQCFLTVFCHFYGAGVGMYVTKSSGEQVMFSLVIISGILFTAYVIVVILEMVRSASSSESKYEELVNQLHEYMRKSKLPFQLRNRLILYYENRFQKHYFREKEILNTLSDHLRYEIFLHSCKGLVEKVEIFQGLPKSTVGTIVANLKHEVFLPNDLIIRAHSTAEYLYFISYGSVAIIFANGREYCHLEDGDHFGDTGLFVEELNNHLLINAIALEITEVFKLEKKDLQHCIMLDEEIAEHFSKFAREKYSKMVDFEYKHLQDKKKQKRDVLCQLREGKILEHTHGKRRL